MERMILENGFVITLDPDRKVIENGSVVIEGDRIVDVGKADDIGNRYSSDQTIDASKKIIMPGLVNAHNHNNEVILRGLSVDTIKEERRNQSGYYWDIDILKNLDKDACYSAGMLCALEMIRSGITCTQNSHYINFHNDAIDGIAQSIADSGLKTVIGRGCWDLPGLTPEEYREDPRTAKIESERFISRWHGNGNGRIIVRTETSRFIQATDEMILMTKDLARKKNLGWGIHVVSRLGEHPVDPRRDDPSIKRYNGRTVEYLRDLDVLGPDTLLIHCGPQITNREIAILANTDSAVAHCPVMNAWAGRHIITPVPAMLEKGISVGLGTDGASTNDSQDLFEVMKVCALLHKVNLGDVKAMTAEKVIEMATIDSAKALQLDKEIGSLEAGKKADIIMLKRDAIGLTPNLIPVKNIVYSTSSGETVDTVIVDGKILMEKKKITTFNEKEVIDSAEETAQRLIQASGHIERDPLYLKPSPWKYT
jgi:5-methylthioadenosine/S-adenosylhomocysteine deaminase